MLLALSTATLDQSLGATEAAGRFVALAEGAGRSLSVAVDPRLDLAQQGAWLDGFVAVGLAVAELTLSFQGRSGRVAPSAASADRDERRAAADQIVDTIIMSADREVGRVVLYPCSLPLRPGPAALQRRFARGEAPAVEQLAARRAALAPGALDGLRGVLELALERAARLGVRLALPGPCPWPHQIPRWAEVERLLDELAGAPLEPAFFMDWAHAAGELGTLDAFPVDASVVRLADASGLRLRLPLGAGEARWPCRHRAEPDPAAAQPAAGGLLLLPDPGLLADSPEEAPAPSPDEAVLTLDVHCTLDELRASLTWIDHHLT